MNKNFTDRFGTGKITTAVSHSFSEECEKASSLEILMYTVENNTGNVNFTLKLFLDDGLLDTISGTISALASVDGNHPPITIKKIIENVKNSILNSNKYILDLNFPHNSADYTPVIFINKILK